MAALLPQQATALHGTVRSAEDGRPIAYAHVRVVGDSVADWSDADGRYRIQNVRQGEWLVRVAHPGHDSLDLHVRIPTGRDVAMDLSLSPKPGPAPEPLADFEPFRVEYTLPALLNTQEVALLIQQAYPAELAEQGIGGEAVLRLWLDEGGRVVRGILSSSSGAPELDSLALHLTDRMRFRPAKNRDDRVRVIVRMPVVFRVPDPESDDPRLPGPGLRRPDS